MTVKEQWKTRGCRLWRIYQDEEPEYTSCLGVGKIGWNEHPYRICAYCGSMILAPKCPYCGGNEWDNQCRVLQRARIEMSGRLPEAAWLADLQSSDVLEVLHGCSGRPDVYRREDVIMRFIEPEIISRLIPQTVPFFDPSDYLEIHALVECDVLLFANGENTA